MSIGLELKMKLADSRIAEEPQKAHQAIAEVWASCWSGATLDSGSRVGVALEWASPRSPGPSLARPPRQLRGAQETRARQAKRTTKAKAAKVSTAQSNCRPEAKSSVPPKKSPLPNTIRDCHHSLKLVGMASAAANVLWAYWGGVSTFSWCAQAWVKASHTTATTTVPAIHHHALARARPGRKAQTSPAANTIGTIPATSKVKSEAALRPTTAPATKAIAAADHAFSQAGGASKKTSRAARSARANQVVEWSLSENRR